MEPQKCAPHHHQHNLSQPAYLPFAKLEGYHFVTHYWIGYVMATQYSPADPLFWSHHSNIDRLFALWQDCNDYEQFNSSSINSTMYSPQTKPGFPCNFTLDTVIPYTSSSDIGPFEGMYPTARQVYFMGEPGNPGFDGMYYRYGLDDIVETVSEINGQPVCVNNKAGWNLVNQTYSGQKRAHHSTFDTDNFTAVNLSSNHPLYNAQQVKAFLEQLFTQAKGQGLSGAAALQYVADLACKSTFQVEISDDFEAFLLMMEVNVNTLDRPCDAVSQRFCKRKGTSHKWCKDYVDDDEEHTSVAPWIIVAGVAGVLFVIIILIVAYFMFTQKPVVGEDINYTKL